jgi:hypothetical protein
MSATPLLDWQPPEPADIRGSTFDQSRDGKRLNAQCQRVFNLMRDGNWRTLAQISFVTQDPEASVSARLRDLRRHGFTVERHYESRGLWSYRLIVNRQAAA